VVKVSEKGLNLSLHINILTFKKESFVYVLSLRITVYFGVNFEDKYA
jgi:hypothetical protein